MIYLMIRLYGNQSNPSGRPFAASGVKRGIPRVETPITPVEPDVLDGGDAVEGVGKGVGVGWAVVSGLPPSQQILSVNCELPTQGHYK